MLDRRPPVRFLPRSLAILLAALAVGVTSPGCVLQRTVRDMEQTGPNPDHGRPGWIQGVATGGAWIGGAVGGLVSVVLLPITYPIDLLAEEEGEPRSHSDARLWFAMEACAAVGHVGFAWPLDGADYLVRRAWVGAPEVPDDSGDPEPVRLWAGPVMASESDVGDPDAARAAAEATNEGGTER